MDKQSPPTPAMYGVLVGVGIEEEVGGDMPTIVRCVTLTVWKFWITYPCLPGGECRLLGQGDEFEFIYCHK